MQIALCEGGRLWRRESSIDRQGRLHSHSMRSVAQNPTHIIMDKLCGCPDSLCVRCPRRLAQHVYSLAATRLDTHPPGRGCTRSDRNRAFARIHSSAYASRNRNILRKTTDTRRRSGKTPAACTFRDRFYRLTTHTVNPHTICTDRTGLTAGGVSRLGRPECGHAGKFRGR